MKKILALLALTLAAALSGCSGANEAKEARMGTYKDFVSESSLTIKEGNGFMMTGPPVLSFAPMGEFTVRDDKIILKVNGEDHIFSIGDGELVFESGNWLESWVEKGTEFYLTGE